MQSTFGPIANYIARGSVLLVLLLFGGRPAVDRRGAVELCHPNQMPPEQPIPFSHAHHVAGLGIDCRYCHTR